MSAWFRYREAENDTPHERYASHEEFRQPFDTGKPGFFQLAYALTADRGLAQECLVSGLEDCRNANTVFREWAQNWARRLIIRNAVRLLRQTSRHENAGADWEEPAVGSAADLPNDSPIPGPILLLPDFERVVYVLSAVERYSMTEIALLLERLPEEIRDARIRAIQQLAAAENEPYPIEVQTHARFAETRLAV